MLRRATTSFQSSSIFFCSSQILSFAAQSLERNSFSLDNLSFLLALRTAVFREEKLELGIILLPKNNTCTWQGTIPVWQWAILILQVFRCSPICQCDTGPQQYTQYIRISSSCPLGRSPVRDAYMYIIQIKKKYK